MKNQAQSKKESHLRALTDNKDKHWYQLFPDRFREESKRMRVLTPKFKLFFKEGEEVRWEGLVGINQSSSEFKIPLDLPYNPLRVRIVCRRDYPLSFPVFIDLDGVLRVGGCEHINPDNSICYAFRPTTELDFINKHYVADAVHVVQTFLLNWYCKQRTGHWPGGEHLHGENAFIAWEFEHGHFPASGLCGCGVGKTYKDCHLAAVERKIASLNVRILGYEGKKKLGRNDRCLCGSGKKYKKCALAGEHQNKERVVQLIQHPSLTKEVLIDLLNGNRAHI